MLDRVDTALTYHKISKFPNLLSYFDNINTIMNRIEYILFAINKLRVFNRELLRKKNMLLARVQKRVLLKHKLERVYENYQLLQRFRYLEINMYQAGKDNTLAQLKSFDSISHFHFNAKCVIHIRIQNKLPKMRYGVLYKGNAVSRQILVDYMCLGFKPREYKKADKTRLLTALNLIIQINNFEEYNFAELAGELIHRYKSYNENIIKEINELRSITQIEEHVYKFYSTNLNFFTNMKFFLKDVFNGLVGLTLNGLSWIDNLKNPFVVFISNTFILLKNTLIEFNDMIKSFVSTINDDLVNLRLFSLLSNNNNKVKQKLAVMLRDSFNPSFHFLYLNEKHQKIFEYIFSKSVQRIDLNAFNIILDKFEQDLLDKIMKKNCTYYLQNLSKFSSQGISNIQIQKEISLSANFLSSFDNIDKENILDIFNLDDQFLMFLTYLKELETLTPSKKEFKKLSGYYKMSLIEGYLDLSKPQTNKGIEMRHTVINVKRLRLVDSIVKVYIMRREFNNYEKNSKVQNEIKSRSTILINKLKEIIDKAFKEEVRLFEQRVSKGLKNSNVKITDIVETSEFVKLYLNVEKLIKSVKISRNVSIEAYYHSIVSTLKRLADNYGIFRKEIENEIKFIESTIVIN